MLFSAPFLLLLSLAPAALAAASSPPRTQESLLPHSKTGRPMPRSIHGHAPAHRRRMDMYQDRSRYADVLAKRNIPDSVVPVGREIEQGGRAEVKQLRKRSTCKSKVTDSSSSLVAAVSSSSSSAGKSPASQSPSATVVNVQANVVATTSISTTAVRSTVQATSSSTRPSSSAKAYSSSSSASIPSRSSSKYTVASSSTKTASGSSSTSTDAYRSSSLFTSTRTTGDLTYYAQGETSCGSTYNDTTYTAAVSHLLYDAWPGATVNTNRNPICGPFVSGRVSLDGSILIAAAESVLVGGDDLLNCIAGVICHKPLTATLTYEGKSVQVEIVDRCQGCAVEDIDVTPIVFEALTGNLGIGRVKGTSGKFTWSFDQ